MKVTLLITQPPESPVAIKALEFANALVESAYSSHPSASSKTITQVFFYAQGVRQALGCCATAQQWQQLIEQYQIATTVCSGSADQYGVNAGNCLLPIAGMGDWLMATLDSDRLVTF